MTEAARLTVGLIDRFSNPARRVAGAADSIDRRVTAAGRAVEAFTFRGLDRVRPAALRAADSLDRFRRSASGVGGAIGALGLGFGAREIGRYADQWTGLTNRVKLFTGSAAEAARVQEQIFQISQRSRAPLGATGELYQRLAQGTKDIGLSSSDLLAVLETINQTLVISGASAAGAEAALVQLGQGFGAGALRGEELNSVLEQAPRLAQLFADGLGVPLGRLRELGKEGELTAERLLGALKSQAGTVASEFGETTTTIDQSFTQISNSFTRLTGALETGLGVFSAVADALGGIADAVEGLGAATDGLTLSDVGAGLEGALKYGPRGVLTGLAVGTVVPGVGTAIGGVAGGVAGLAGGFGSGVADNRASGRRREALAATSRSGASIDHDNFEARQAAVTAVAEAAIARAANSVGFVTEQFGDVASSMDGLANAVRLAAEAQDATADTLTRFAAQTSFGGAEIGGPRAIETAGVVRPAFRRARDTTSAAIRRDQRDAARDLLQKEREIAAQRSDAARAIDAVGSALSATNPTLAGFAGAAAALVRGDALGAAIAGVSTIATALSNTASPAEKLRQSLDQAAEASRRAADAIEHFALSTQDRTATELSKTQGAFFNLQRLVSDIRAVSDSFYVNAGGQAIGGGTASQTEAISSGDANQILGVIFGKTSGKYGRIFESLADELDISLSDLLERIQSIEQTFEGLDLSNPAGDPFGTAGAFAERARSQLSNFGAFDLGTFGGATGDFSHRRRIARPGADLRTIFAESFGQLLEGFNAEELSFSLKEGVELSSAQERTLKELLAELRDFHADATKEDRITERLLRERFRGEELAVRSKFAGKFAAAGGDEFATNQLLRDMARELEALAKEEKAFLAAVKRGDLGATLGTGLDAGGTSGAAKGALGATRPTASDLLDTTGIEPIRVSPNDVLRITGQIRFIRWEQAVDFSDAEPARFTWPDVVRVEGDTGNRQAPPEGWREIVDVSPETAPPLRFTWPTVVSLEGDAAARHQLDGWTTVVDIPTTLDPFRKAWPTLFAFDPAPGDRHSLDGWATVADVPADLTPLRRPWPAVVALDAAPGSRHTPADWAVLAAIPGDLAAIRRTWPEVVALDADPAGRHVPSEWGQLARVPGDIAKIRRTWPNVVALELDPAGRHIPAAWSILADVPAGLSRMGRAWPEVVSLAVDASARHRPAAWSILADVPAGLSRMGRAWPTVVNMLRDDSLRHRAPGWAALADVPDGMTKYRRNWPDVVTMAPSHADRHKATTWVQLVELPGLTPYTRQWPDVVRMTSAPAARHIPIEWSTLADVPSGTRPISRAWPDAVAMTAASGLRHTPGIWHILADVPTSTAKIAKAWPTAVRMDEAPDLRHAPGQWASLVEIPSELNKIFRAWPEAVRMISGGGRHTPNHWSTLTHVPDDLQGIYRYWWRAVDMIDAPLNTKPTPANWAEVVNIPDTLTPIEISPAQFVRVSGPPVEVDVNDLFRPVGSIEVAPGDLADGDVLDLAAGDRSGVTLGGYGSFGSIF